MGSGQARVRATTGITLSGTKNSIDMEHSPNMLSTSDTLGFSLIPTHTLSPHTGLRQERAV
jgi:hypothetical protein